MRNTSQSTNDPNFLKKLEEWFNNRPEILILIRYPYAAGNREFEFFLSFEQLQNRIRGLRQRTSIIAFRQPLLPLRGVVDDEFIAKCLEAIPETKEYLVVETVRRTAGKYSWFHDDEGISHAQLREALEECRGATVAAGICPNYIDDSEDVISAIIPDDDGIVRPAAY
jgi:hypothetical protein